MDLSLDAFLAWYLSPYQKLTKGPFGLYTTLVAMVGLGIEYFLPSDSPGMFSQLASLAKGGSDPTAMLDTLTKAAGVTTPAGAAVAAPFDWSTLIDSTLTLLVLPLMLMRLRDMGKHGPTLWVLLGLTYLGTATDLLRLAGLDSSWFGTGAGALTFIMWLWLSSAKTAGPKTPKVEGAFVTAARSDHAPAFDPRKPPPPDSTQQDY